MRLPTILQTAVHEAGHAVIWLGQPAPPPIASIVVGRDRGGELGKVDVVPRWRPHAMLRGHPDPEVEALWRTWATSDVWFFLAGPIAEMRWRRYTRAKIILGAAEMAERCLGPRAPAFGSDLHQVRLRLESAHRGDEIRTFIGCWLATEEAVATRMHTIEHLGRLLAARGRLDEDEIVRFWAVRCRNHSTATRRGVDLPGTYEGTCHMRE